MARGRPTTRKTTGGTSTPRPLSSSGLVAVQSLSDRSPPPELPFPVQSHHGPAVISKQQVGSGSGVNSQVAESWCSLCGDGGSLPVACDKCNRANCTLCVPGLAEIDKALLDSLEYRCPPCHGRRQRFYGLWQGDEPFFPDGMQISETAISGHGARLSSSSLAIVEFILGTLPKQGTPAQVLFTYLQACFTPNPNHLEHFKCELDINRNDLAPHQAKLRKLARSLGRGKFDRVILIVHTHADKDSGGLFYCGDGNASTSMSAGVANFFDVVIGQELREFILGRTYSLLVLAACGSVVNLPNSLEELRGVANTFQFSDAFAFSNPRLDPYRIIPFINEFSMNVLIAGRKSSVALPTVLSSSSTIQFTGVVHLKWKKSGVRMERFERVHPTSRPNGVRLSQQCPICNAYCPWVVPSSARKKYNEKQAFKCVTKKCPGLFKVRRLKGYRPIPRDRAILYSKSL